MQNNDAKPTPKPEKDQSKNEEQKKLVETLKTEWKQMWNQRFDDKVKAEGVSVTDYNTIKVEQGTIIQATKDFKALNFREILDEHLVENPDRYIEPSNSLGGWNKFIKTNISKWKTLVDKNTPLIDRIHESEVEEYLSDALRIVKGIKQPSHRSSPSS